MLEAGNYTFFQNYDGAVMLSTNATTYLDCYQKCIKFNGGTLDLPSRHYLAAITGTNPQSINYIINHNCN
jgi:hypothetical protein